MTRSISPPHWIGCLIIRRRVTPNIKVAGTHLFARVKKGTVRVKVSCPRTKHKVSGQGLNTDSLIQTTPHAIMSHPKINHQKTAMQGLSADSSIQFHFKYCCPVGNDQWQILNNHTSELTSCCIVISTSSLNSKSWPSFFCWNKLMETGQN